MPPNRVASLPIKPGLVIYHNGLTPEEVAAARERQYETQDVRLLEGPELVERSLQAAIIGTAFLTESQFEAIKLANQIYKDKEPGETDKRDKRVTNRDDVDAILSMIPTEAKPAKPVTKKVMRPAVTEPLKETIDDEYDRVVQGLHAAEEG